MNPFDKIYNFQIISHLDETDSFVLTSQERIWLKTMLKHPAADEAFSPDTLSKLHTLLASEPIAEVSEIIIEKAKSQERQVYHPLLRTLRRLIMQDQGILLTYLIKHGGVKTNQSGFPSKLEYNMAKKEWYLQWYSTRMHTLMYTKLKNIISVEQSILPNDKLSSLNVKLEQLLKKRYKHAIIQIMPTYNDELSRILYAFSCFEKSVLYDEAANTYQVKVTYLADESEFLLSKIRFLGLRVQVVVGDQLKRRMLESTTKALERYGAEN